MTSDLLRKPTGEMGKVHDITVASAKGPKTPDWAYVGFGVYRLSAGDQISVQDENERYCGPQTSPPQAKHPRDV